MKSLTELQKLSDHTYLEDPTFVITEKEVKAVGTRWITTSPVDNGLFFAKYVGSCPRHGNLDKEREQAKKIYEETAKRDEEDWNARHREYVLNMEDTNAG